MAEPASGRADRGTGDAADRAAHSAVLDGLEVSAASDTRVGTTDRHAAERAGADLRRRQAAGPCAEYSRRRLDHWRVRSGRRCHVSGESRTGMLLARDVGLSRTCCSSAPFASERP